MKKEVLGEIYGRLVIIGEDVSYREPNGKLQRVVICKCSCGNTVSKQLKELRNGGAKSCGCLNKEQKKSVVEGDIFSHWTILKEGTPYIYKGKKSRTFNAKCICGKEKKNITLTSLTSGKSKSCGCQGKDKKVKKKWIKLPIPLSTEEEQWVEAFEFPGYYISSKGRIFSYKGGRKYLNTTNKTGLYLNSEKINRRFNISEVLYKSFFGTWDEEKYMLIFIDDNRYNKSLDNLFLARKTNNGVNWVVRAFTNMKSSGQRKGQRKKSRTLTKRHIIETYKKQGGLSYYLKLPMDLTGEDLLLSISVDRLDNDRDYEEGNIVLATRFENMGRRTATVEQMIELCRHIEYKGTL